MIIFGQELRLYYIKDEIRDALKESSLAHEITERGTILVKSVGLCTFPKSLDISREVMPLIESNTLVLTGSVDYTSNTLRLSRVSF